MILNTRITIKLASEVDIHHFFIRHMRKYRGFRGWFYFRQGYSTYFAFILAAINALTVTYFLAVEEYPSLQTIFPTFELYVVTISCIGIPFLILIGYIHYKRTAAYKSETSILFESNPYSLRNIVNNQINLQINLELLKMLSKLLSNEKLTEPELKEIRDLEKRLREFTKTRKFEEKQDLSYLDKIRDNQI